MLTYFIHVEHVCNLLKRILDHLHAKTYLRVVVKYIIKTLETYTGVQSCTAEELERDAAEIIQIKNRKLTGGLRVVRMDKAYYEIASYINTYFEIGYPERGIAEAWTFYCSFVDYLNNAYELPRWFQYVQYKDCAEVIIQRLEIDTDPVQGFRIGTMTRPSAEEETVIGCMLYAYGNGTLSSFIELPSQTTLTMYYELARIN